MTAMNQNNLSVFTAMPDHIEAFSVPRSASHPPWFANLIACFCRFVQLDIYIAISDEITYNNIYFSSAKSCEAARQGVYFS